MGGGEKVTGGEFFTLRNGRSIMSDVLSTKMYEIKIRHPDSESEDSSGYEWSEIGMANLFGEIYSKEARYCPEHKTWYTYYDGAWRQDEGAILVGEKMKDFVRLMSMYCGEILDDDRREKYMNFVKKMGDRRMRERILKDATGELHIHAVDLDAKPYLVNCLNGTYDLRTLTFREPRWDDFLTMQTRFNHTVDKDLRCDRWERFIDEVTEGDKDKAGFLQRSLGYSLLGESSEECMFILYGKTTRNGKSTLLNTIEYMLGDYASVAPVGLICKGDRQRNEEAASPVLASLKGKRFVTMSESNEYGRMDEERIKLMTGGEGVTARHLYGKSFTYVPQFSLWLSCNDLPIVTDKSLFASDRIKVVEFNRHFSDSEQDKHLKQELTSESAMAGIFNWLVEGYVNYREHGLKMTEDLRRPIRMYEKDNDIIWQFLNARFEKGSETDYIKAKDLYQAFKTWAKSEGYYQLSARKFNSEMERHPEWFDRRAFRDGYPTYYGLKRKEEYL